MKNFINTALLKEQLKRFWPIAALPMLWYLLVVVMEVYLAPTNANHWLSGEQLISAAMFILMTMWNVPLLWAMIAVPFCATMALYSYSFKTASTTAFHSLPLNRNQLFFTNLLAGLTLMLTPLLITSLIILMPVRFAEGSINEWLVLSAIPGIECGDVINTPLRVGGFFLRNALGFTLYFAIFMLAASLAGSRVIAITLAGVIAILPTALTGLGMIIGEFYIFGLAPPTYIGVVTTHMHPFFWGRAFGWIPFLFRGGTVPHHTLVISYSLITLACLGLAYLAYRLRPQERAGDAVVFTPVRRVLIFLEAAIGMFFVGVIGLVLFASRAGLYLGFVVGFAIAYFIAQMIAEKTFRVGHKAKHLVSYGAVAAGVYLLMLLVVNVGFSGYMRRVPDAREIEGVHVHQRWGAHTAPQDVFIYDAATIAWVQDIHRRIIDERGYVQRHFRNNSNNWHISMSSFTIMYRLENGRIMSRSYRLPNNFFEDKGINALMQSDPVIQAGFPALRDPANIRFIEVTVRNADYWAVLLDADIARARGRGDAEYIAELHAALTAPFMAHIDNAAQIFPLAIAVRRDISYEARAGAIDWRNDISVFVDTGDSTYEHRSGFWTRVRMGGYTAEWLVANGVLAELLE